MAVQSYYGQDVIFDASTIKWVTPTTMTFLAKIWGTVGRNTNGSTIRVKGLEKNQYAINMGFAEALNLEGNPFPKKALGNENYKPMSVLNRDELNKRAALEFLHFNDVVQKYSESLAKVVTRDKSPRVMRAIENSFREIIRNVFEHSGSDNATYCVQYWPSQDEVEICISDRGVGIATSLSEEAKFANLNDDDALLMCLMPGVSARALRNKKKASHQRSDWDNAGYGLFFCKEIFGNLGHFGLVSNRAGILVRDGVVEQFEANIDGTLVSMRLKLSDIDALEAIVSEVGSKASEIKQRLGVKNLTPESVKAFLLNQE